VDSQGVHSSGCLLASEKGVGIKLKLDEGFSIIHADARRLRRAFANLLENAVKYSREDSTVSISSWSTDREISVQFKDQGMGIDPADLPHIFVPFHRGNGSNEEKGFGMGLASAKAIVEGHGGQVFVESRLNKGSVFTVVLPMTTNSGEESGRETEGEGLSVTRKSS